MNEPTNHWKLGLFVVMGGMLMVTALVYLGTRSLNKASVEYISFFDEAVTGLEAGSPVRFRGVDVGKVARIELAPDRRHVAVRYALVVSVLSALRLAAERGDATRLTVPRDLRAQLGSTGVTGVKYVLLDFFDPEDHPPPPLPFRVPRRYIPATPSMLKDLEEAVVRAVDELPKVARDSQEVLARLNAVLGSLAQLHVPERAVSTLTQIDGTFALLRAKLNQVDARQLSGDAHATLAALAGTLARMQSAIDRVDGERGLLASMQRASDSLGDVASGSRGYGPELVDALRELRDAADSFRELVDAVSLDPDMLLKGRAKEAR